MSGKHITQEQGNLYMKSRQAGLTQELSAAKAGVSVRTGRRIEKGEQAGKKERHWRTRQDPLEAVWSSELVPLLDDGSNIGGRYRVLIKRSCFANQCLSAVYRTYRGQAEAAV